MTDTQGFRLQPFPGSGAGSELEIAGEITRRGARLAIRCELQGRMAELAIPAPPAGGPARKQGLWEETCFEFFLGVKGSGRYWEFNLSPAGHWNVYRFTGYRRGMEEEEAFGSLPFSVARSPASLVLIAEVGLAGIVQADQGVEVGIAAVVKDRDGGLTYWALAHPGAKPDFHRREGFIIGL